MSSDRLTAEWLKGYVGDRLYDCLRCGKTGMTHDATYRHAVFDCNKRRPECGAAKVGVDGHHLRGVLGVFSAVVTMTGWTGRKFKSVEESQAALRKDFDDKINSVHARVTPLMADVAELRAHHEAKMQRLTTIESGMREIDKKQDQQMRILYRLDGKNRGGGGDE